MSERMRDRLAAEFRRSKVYDEAVALDQSLDDADVALDWLSRDAVIYPRCRCVWNAVRCEHRATQEDGLCDWCGHRRDGDIRPDSPGAMFGPDGEFLGLGGAPYKSHDIQNQPPGSTPACWYPESGRTLA